MSQTIGTFLFCFISLPITSMLAGLMFSRFSFIISNVHLFIFFDNISVANIKHIKFIKNIYCLKCAFCVLQSMNILSVIYRNYINIMLNKPTLSALIF